MKQQLILEQSGIEELKPSVKELVDISGDMFSRVFIPFVAFDEEKVKDELRRAKQLLNKMEI